MSRFWLIAVFTLFASACVADSPLPDDNQVSSDAEGLKRPPQGNPCAAVLCLEGQQCVVECGQARCVPQYPVECKTDADCRLFSDYCEGCNCLALGRKEPDPVCDGQLVQCLLDPCRGLQAVCTYGSCVASRGGAVTF